MPANAEQAKEAIEVVCPGGLDRMEELYRPDFHDSHGLVAESIKRSREGVPVGRPHHR